MWPKITLLWVGDHVRGRRAYLTCRSDNGVYRHCLHCPHPIRASLQEGRARPYCAPPCPPCDLALSGIQQVLNKYSYVHKGKKVLNSPVRSKFLIPSWSRSGDQGSLPTSCVAPGRSHTLSVFFCAQPSHCSPQIPVWLLCSIPAPGKSGSRPRLPAEGARALRTDAGSGQRPAGPQLGRTRGQMGT